MTNEQIAEMVEDIVGEIDYDYYKEIYVYDPEETADRVKELESVAKKHLPSCNRGQVQDMAERLAQNLCVSIMRNHPVDSAVTIMLAVLCADLKELGVQIDET